MRIGLSVKLKLSYVKHSYLLTYSLQYLLSAKNLLFLQAFPPYSLLKSLVTVNISKCGRLNQSNWLLGALYKILFIYSYLLYSLTYLVILKVGTCRLQDSVLVSSVLMIDIFSTSTVLLHRPSSPSLSLFFLMNLVPSFLQRLLLLMNF